MGAREQADTVGEASEWDRSATENLETRQFCFKLKVSDLLFMLEHASLGCVPFRIDWE